MGLPVAVVLTGNISAGKSTLCRALADNLGYTLYLEPTIENPFLVKYYKCVPVGVGVGRGFGVLVCGRFRRCVYAPGAAVYGPCNRTRERGAPFSTSGMAIAACPGCGGSVAVGARCLARAHLHWRLCGVLVCRRREPKRYALPMQCWLLKQRFVTYVTALRDIIRGRSSSAGVILDRSVGGARGQGFPPVLKTRRVMLFTRAVLHRPFSTMNPSRRAGGPSALGPNRV